MVEKYIIKTKTSSSDIKASKDDRKLKNSLPQKKRLTVNPKKANQQSGFLPDYKKAFPKTARSLDLKYFFKGQFHTGFIKRGPYEISRKSFMKKINLNKVQVLEDYNALRVKASVYILLKNLKNLKKITLSPCLKESSLDSLDQFCLKLEKSGFYSSFTEWKKKRTFDLLRVKTKKRLCNGFAIPFKSKKHLIEGAESLNYLIPVKSSYQIFQKKTRKVNDSLSKIKMKDAIIKKGFVHLKNNYSYMTESRVSLYMATYKKKYTKSFRIMKRYKLKFRRLFFDFLIKQLRHTSRMKKRYKLYRSFAWKRKKKKNRKKVGLFYFLRKRPRMLFRFYIPRHLEINYKTFSLAHLGELDLSSVNPRISLWLNLRRLLTSLAI